MRLKNKIAMVVGAGQPPGPTIGNGRATALLFAREGAQVLAVDRDIDSAQETVELIQNEGGQAEAIAADVVDEASLEAAVKHCKEHLGQLDILHNNVGISVTGGDAPVTEISTEAFDRIISVNLRGVVLACKHALPVMRAQGSGTIITISSIAAIENYPWVAYKASKAALVTLTQQLAIQNAEYGIRANVILPGLMDTPMAVDNRAQAWGQTREEVVAARNARVPLGNKMGDAWDVAHAALFLASDEARFITGVSLPVDGGMSCRIG